MNLLSCPFCPFSDYSVYFISQHVELAHSEVDEPPFVARHFLEEDRVGNDGGQEAATTQDTPSQNYIECECGEAVHLTEFNDHVQLHTAESADMALDSTQMPAGVTPPPPKQHLAWTATASPLHLLDLNTLSTATKASKLSDQGREARSPKLKHISRSNINKEHPKVKEWIDLLIGSTTSTTRTKNHSAHPKNARRLGVSRHHESGLGFSLIYQTEGGARSLCPRRANAGMAIQTVGTRRHSFNSQSDKSRWQPSASGSGCQ